MGEGSDIVTVRIPYKIRKRGGRKLILAPDGTDAGIEPRCRVDNAMIKALARGFRWRKLLEHGTYGTIEEIAAAERINASYVGRLLRLTLLSPEIVEAILDGRQPVNMTLAVLVRPFSVSWQEQLSIHLTPLAPRHTGAPECRSMAAPPASAARR